MRRLLPFVSLAACASSTPPVMAPVSSTLAPQVVPCPPPPPPASPPGSGEDALGGFLGKYSLVPRAITHDTCGGAVQLAARHIVITPDHELKADVVDRTYRAGARAGVLGAEGTFEASTCEGGKLYEHWAFVRAGDDLEGVLVSEWPLAMAPSINPFKPRRYAPGDAPCTDRCRVVFTLQAVKER